MIKCGFFNSIDNDRTYNADDMAMPYKRLITNGIFPKETGEQSDDLKVTADGTMTIKVNSGNGIFDYKWVENTSPFELTVSLADTFNSRIDSVVMRVNYDTRTCEFKIINGEPAESPIPPDIIRDNHFIDYRLANITVETNAVGINNIHIEDTRASTDCGFITHLIEQADITSIYSQWQAQFDDWFKNLKETLSTVTIISSFSSQYTTTSANEKIIPINIERFNSVIDILQVYVNGLLAIKDVDYTIDSFNNIVMTSDNVLAGTKISFIVYKSVDGSAAETVVREVDELFVRVRSLEADTGWIDIPLYSGVEEFNAYNKPKYRRVGKVVYIRGAVKGKPTNENKIIGTLPSGLRPTINHTYVQATSTYANDVCYFTRLSVNVNGEIKFEGWSENVPADAPYIPINTSFLID